MKGLIALFHKTLWERELIYAEDGSEQNDTRFRIERGKEFLKMFCSIDTAFEAEDWPEFRGLVIRAISGPSAYEAELRAAVYAVSPESVKEYCAEISERYLREINA